MSTGGTILSWGLIFSIAFGPLVYFYFWSNQKKRRIIRLLNNAAVKHKLDLKKTETWNDKGIGYDKANKSLIYVSMANNSISVIHIRMAEVRNIQLINDPSIVAIQFKKKNNKVVDLVFYNDMFEQALNSEVTAVIARRWHLYLKNEIKHKPLLAA